MLYHREVNEDSRFRNATTKDAYELTIDARPNTGTPQRYENVKSKAMKKQPEMKIISEARP